MASEETFILRVGDRARVEGHGDRLVERIDVCLTPSTDAAGEENFATVEIVEVGEHGPPFTVVMEGGGWAYGIQVKEIVEAGDHE